MKMDKFRELGLAEEILQAISKEGFSEPSEIQKKTIPLALEGKDIIGSSATGSGKTLAFGAGIIENVQKGRGVQALILTPTRELAEQVAVSLRKFAKHYKLNIKDVYGGVSMGPQIRDLRVSEIVVATPGRLLDHLNQGTISLRLVRYLVLDEADRMLDMGFIRDVEKIISRCPTDRQTLLFSATISREIESIANRHMRNPVFVEVDNQVDPNRLSATGYGEYRPVASNEAKEGRQENRRVEIVILPNTTKESAVVESESENLK
jgi:ATP-dependent RNA helicase DeaD